MKYILYFMVVFLCSISFLCVEGLNDESKNTNYTDQNIKKVYIEVGYPKEITSDITVDALGNVWFTVTGVDTSHGADPGSRYSPPLTRVYKFDGSKYYVIYDNITEFVNHIAIDQNENIWLMNGTTIMKIGADNELKIIARSGKDCAFTKIAIDKQNIVWAGGFNTGLYKIQDEKIEIYTTNNSNLPTNSLVDIYVDKRNITWIALWDLMGIIKVENYQLINVPWPYKELGSVQVRSLVVDCFNNIYIGAGSENSTISLIKYDGKVWSINNPKNEIGSDIQGIIYNLTSNISGKIWAYTTEVKNSTAIRFTLSVFDGTGWKIMKDAADNNFIKDMKSFNNKIFLVTNYKIYIID
jgi:hypothetical protein